MKGLIFNVLSFFVFCPLFLFGQSANTNAEPLKIYEQNGIQVKSFDFNGLEDYIKPEKDTLYVINFWATWCGPCVEELPHFERINSEFKNQKVRVILVSLDMSKQVTTRLIPYIQKNNIKSEVVLLNDLDADVWINKVDASWSGALPATLFYTNQKRFFFEKSFTYETLLEQLKNFL
ncbi:redoxin domain-containing protein [Flavobacterium sp.]|uniref:TlpA disulfide reductase family protein n=1 Tax=Flavobacterium sp. TaxID=239 RepID=UPI0026373CBC|nr:redoxin domain-containing protein [Flavobacterium sp.]MDD3003798.1 redoxin domain-containing protein [Flavobacterium sp.]